MSPTARFALASALLLSATLATTLAAASPFWGSPASRPVGTPPTAPRLAADEDFRWEPEKSLSGPVALLLSSTDQRVVVPRNGVEIGRSRIHVRGAERTPGSHVFVAHAYDGVLPPWAFGATGVRWVGVAIPGHEDDANRALPPDEVARIALPPEFRPLVEPLLVPGTTLYVTDLPILPDGSGALLRLLDCGA